MKTRPRWYCDRCGKDITFRVIWRYRVRRVHTWITSPGQNLELCPECGRLFWKWLQAVPHD